MADNYATIQQHQPLRTPAGWDRQEKALIVQLDEIFDDLYRRFGRLRLADMGKAFRKQIADDEGNIAQLTLDVSGLVIEVGNKISKTATYQTADSIVTAAVSQAATSASQTYIAKTTTLQTADAIVTEATTQAATSASQTYIAKTSTYQDAASIVTAAEGYTDGQLTSYSTTSQMNDAINLSVAGIAPAFSTSAAYAVGDIVSYNGKIYKFTSAHSAGAWNSSQVTQTSLSSDAYLVQSGITIDANGIDITGSKYVKIRSGGTFYVSATDFLIDSPNKKITIGGWDFDSSGFTYTNASSQKFLFCNSYNYGDTNIKGAICFDSTANGGHVDFFVRKSDNSAYGDLIYETSSSYLTYLYAKGTRFAVLGTRSYPFATAFMQNIIGRPYLSNDVEAGSVLHVNLSNFDIDNSSLYDGAYIGISSEWADTTNKITVYASGPIAMTVPVKITYGKLSGR